MVLVPGAARRRSRIGLPVGLAIGHTGRGRFVAANLAGLWRAMPTVGIVGLLFEWRPLTLWPVLVALVVLAVPPIVLNTAAGIDSIPPDIRDAARGMGLTGMQTLWQVEIPNALPLIIAGVRSAANQVIATATIAGFVGLGGLGRVHLHREPDPAARDHGGRIDRGDRARARRRGGVRVRPTAGRVAGRAAPVEPRLVRLPTDIEGFALKS